MHSQKEQKVNPGLNTVGLNVVEAGAMSIIPQTNTYNFNNAAVKDFVAQMAALCEPKEIYWCDGSQAENERLIAEMVSQGKLIKIGRASCRERV